MSVGSNFLKPALAPLNFANVSLMGKRIGSGLQELAAENLMTQLRRGIADAAKRAAVREADIEKLLPMARFVELARSIDGAQKIAVHAWRDRPVESRRSADLANLTETGKLPVLADSLMRLAIMTGANAELRSSLHTMAAVMREWQELALKAGTKLDDDRALAGAFNLRTLRRALAAACVLCLVGVGIGLWQRVERARSRINAQIGSHDPCAVLAIDPSDMGRATEAQRKDIDNRRRDCEDKRAREAKEQEERAKQEEYAKQCVELAGALEQNKAPGALAAILSKPLALANRIGKGALEASDFGPTDPTFPCADRDEIGSIRASFDRAIVKSNGWIDNVDLSPRVIAALEKLQDQVPAAVKKDLDERAEKESVAALVDRQIAKIQRAKHLCRLKLLFKLQQRAFCSALAQ